MSNIVKSFEIAFETMEKKKWDKIYVAVDIHDTIFKGCYHNEETFKWLGQSKAALQMMTKDERIVLILWSSVYPGVASQYLSHLYDNGIDFDYFNQNPEVEDSDLACFDTKFYFNVGIDDKFGFEPETDWDRIIDFLVHHPINTEN